MKICLECRHISVQSKEPFFTKERDGHKNNTVRIVNDMDKQSLINLQRKVENKEDVSILVYNYMHEDQFKRHVTDISIIGRVAGQSFVVITWL